MYRFMKRSWVMSLGALALWACQSSTPAPPQAPASAASAPASTAPASAAVSGLTPAQIDDPKTCQPCHAAIYSEWSESMHSRAHHDADPIFGAMRALRMKKQGAQVADACAQCHTPRAPAAPESPAARAGVSCAACHALDAVHPDPKAPGAKAMTFNPDGLLRSARDRPAGIAGVHGTGKALAALADGKTLCLACHAQATNPAGVPVCTTGAELGDAAQTCTRCHMRQVKAPGGAVGRRDGHASHQFAGPHRAWLQSDPSMLQSGIELNAQIKDGAVHVTLRNRSGHAFPSGYPGRMAVVHIAGLARDGAVLWRNIKGDAMADHPDAVLNKVYVDAKGKPVMPPFASALKRDTRLKPDEVRSVVFALPEPTAHAVKVTVAFHLLPPPAAKALGLADAPEAKPKIIASAQVAMPR